MRRWLPLAAAALLGACSLAAPTSKERAVQSMENFTMTQTSQGTHIWQLQAPQARITLEGEAHLDQPHILFFKEGKRASDVRSKEAFVPEGSRNVLLSGDVVVISFSENSRINTEHLQYVAAKNQFHTDDPVTLVRPDAVIHGRGMDADSSLSTIEIYHQQTALQ